MVAIDRQGAQEAVEEIHGQWKRLLLALLLIANLMTMTIIAKNDDDNDDDDGTHRRSNGSFVKKTQKWAKETAAR